MEKITKQFIDGLSDYSWDRFAEYMSEYLSFHDKLSESDWERLWNQIQGVDNDCARLVFGHDCLSYVHRGEIFEAYLLLLKDTDVIDWSQKYYLLWQVTRIMFGKTVTDAQNIKKYSYEIYHQILQAYKELLDDLRWITKEERNDNLVFVLVEQFIGDNHGPTKTTLDRARVLRKKLGKNVMIINTAEQFGGNPINLPAPFYANYNDSLLQQESITYEGDEYPFIQFANNMPNVLNGNEFIQFVRKYKPGFIVNIGGLSLLADACAELVPVININTVPSEITETEATAQTVGNDITDEDIQLLKFIGKTRDDVIKGRFTSSLKPQEHTYTKQMLGIPENRFILTIVGGRLTSEADDRFCSMIEPALKAGAFLVVIGEMKTYPMMSEKYKELQQNSIYLGLQKDVQAVLECCDLYVNPDRTGGGTSVIEAMYKKLPVISLNHGDVALGAGLDFCVETYEQMTEELIHYMHDQVFYKEMSEKAKKRADYMLDSDTAFQEIISEFYERFCNR